MQQESYQVSDKAAGQPDRATEQQPDKATEQPDRTKIDKINKIDLKSVKKLWLVHHLS